MRNKMLAKSNEDTPSLTSKSEGISEKESKSPKKIQHSALKILRGSLKFKYQKNNEKKLNDKPQTFNGVSPKVLDANSTKKHPSHSSKRLSAQRVTLFKYENVQVMNCTSQVALRKGSVSSSGTYVQRSFDDASSHSLKSGTTINMKPISLISQGLLEVYQIITPTPNANELPQTMSYLALGRHANIIHPILPKLQVMKLSEYDSSFSILLFNPERYWRLQFLSSDNSVASKDQLTKAVSNFESVISQISNYSNGDTVLSYEMDVNDFIQKGIAESNYNSNDNNNNDTTTTTTTNNNDDDDDDDDLNYLLDHDYDSIPNMLLDPFLEDVLPIGNDHPYGRQTIEKKSNATNRITRDNEINIAFKRAIKTFSPYWNEYISNTVSSEPSHISKRYSSYQLGSFDIVSTQSSSYSLNRRSISMGAHSQNMHS